MGFGRHGVSSADWMIDKNFIHFCQGSVQQNNLGVSASLMKNLHSLKRLVIYKSIEKKKQVTLEKFVASLQK